MTIVGKFGSDTPRKMYGIGVTQHHHTKFTPQRQK